ncbi:hypothetical protein AVEN_133820-1 [Araneus ventricosus]|uniref:Uncharacterized protein n=1 Tax=Araneus ventricosus TaxID=182803 RepID=A0A4Y2QZE8_ARAVE|nr:hypothetical protein AVEN_133820-1 [Araneus ventricosus]
MIAILLSKIGNISHAFIYDSKTRGCWQLEDSINVKGIGSIISIKDFKYSQRNQNLQHDQCLEKRNQYLKSYPVMKSHLRTTSLTPQRYPQNSAPKRHIRSLDEVCVKLY